MMKEIKGYEGLYYYFGENIVQLEDSGAITMKPTLADGELIIRLCKNNVCKIHKVKELIK